MGDLDSETIEWLNSLKLGDKLSYLSDFDNGYYMGVIFERTNLAKGKKFKNTNDMACKFQNFKNIRDLLYENFKVDFPIQNILFNTENLLRTIRDSIKKYNRQRKQATLRRIQTFSESKIQPNEEKMFASRQRDILMTSKLNQTGKFPKKIQEIEQKLEKFRQIKTKHELMALDDRKKEIEENRRLVDEHRLFELNKVRANHEFMREHERKVYDVWMKTEQIKKTRMEKDTLLKTFLDEKKNKFYQSQRNEEVNAFKQGLESFQLNCIRQGIELQHDPDKPLAKTEQNFNKQVVLERIKDNIKIHDQQRKDRIKRENKKAVDAKEASIKAEGIWEQNNLVEKYAAKMNDHMKQCEQLIKTFNRENAEKKITRQKYKIKPFTELPSALISEEERKDQYRKRMMQYRDEEIKRLEKKQKELKTLAEGTLQALIHIVVSNQQLYYKNEGFSYSQWKVIQKEFLGCERKEKIIKGQTKYIDQSYQINAKQYINSTGQWRLPKQQKIIFKLSDTLGQVIEKAHPPLELPPKKDIPLYMPLKIGLVGNHLSGKTTLAQQISNKYGVMIINPQQVINQALELNKEPVNEDPKKKKDSKKPEQQNPEKTALKEWGAKLMQKISSASQASTEHFIDAIQFKLRYCYQNKTSEEILKQFEESKTLQVERLNKAIKQFEQAQKKGKKDSKKGNVENEQPPSERKYFYTKGFIIDGIELSLQAIKQIEYRLNGYLSFQERVNKIAEETKQAISPVIPLQKAVKSNQLQKGVFDLLIEVDTKMETLQTRNPEKAELNVKEYSDIKKYYSNFGNKRTKMNAFQTISNESTIEECIGQFSNMIEMHLTAKYEQIQHKQQEEIPIPSSQEAKKQQQQSSPEKVIETNFISKQDGKKLIERFNSVFGKYQKNVAACFSEYDNLRGDFNSRLLNIQQNFLNIINRPDDKAGKILTFQENYNKLLSEKTNIVKDVEASRHLISKLDEVNDSIWVSIESKKNQAVAQRQKNLRSSFLSNQVEKIVEVSKKLCENELTLLVQIIFFIYNLNNTLCGVKQEIPTEYLVLGIPPNLEPILSFVQSEFVSDRLDYYTRQTKACIDQLPSWLKKREKKFKIAKSEYIESLLTDFIGKQVTKIYRRLEQIREKTKERYLEYYCFFKALTNKMDDWIILGIKHENQFVYDIYRTIKQSIIEARKSSVKDLFVRDITETIRPISGLPPSKFPVVAETAQNHFKILSFLIFMQEIKCLSNSGRIPFKQFKAYMEKRKKSKWLCQQFLQLQFDIMQQYLVTEEYCNFKEVTLAMLLWRAKALDEDSIADYHKSLCGYKEASGEEPYNYFKEQLSFGQFVLMPGVTEDQHEERILTAFVYQIFREQFKNKLVVKDYIDTLRLFSQLQVFKYGDTLMILNESKAQ